MEILILEPISHTISYYHGPWFLGKYYRFLHRVHGENMPDQLLKYYSSVVIIPILLTCYLSSSYGSSAFIIRKNQILLFYASLGTILLNELTRLLST